VLGIVDELWVNVKLGSSKQGLRKIEIGLRERTGRGTRAGVPGPVHAVPRWGQVRVHWQPWRCASRLGAPAARGMGVSTGASVLGSSFSCDSDSNLRAWLLVAGRPWTGASSPGVVPLRDLGSRARGREDRDQGCPFGGTAAVRPGLMDIRVAVCAVCRI
jgi:hypothetical protein